MALDGALLGGHYIRCRRPKDYHPTAGHTTKQWVIGDIVSSHVPDGPDKIYLGGLPETITDEQLRQIAESFGKLKAYTLVRDTMTGQLKGFAFFSYQDARVTQDAIKGLNGITVGGKSIVCKLARKNEFEDPQALLNPNNPAYSALISALGGGPVPPPPTPFAALPAPAAAALPATPVLVFQNMVTPHELGDAEEYEDILLDIREECSKYGAVATLAMPRPNNITGDQSEVGKVFVEFVDSGGAAKAQIAMHGRLFASRTIVVSYMSIEEWQQRRAHLLAGGQIR
jgi:splicing factor U2AF subunit